MRIRGVKPISIKSEIKNVRALLNYLQKKRVISPNQNFGKDLIVPKVHYDPEPLISAELAEELIIKATTPGKYDHVNHRERKAQMRIALRFLLRTGLRGAELTSIKGSDLLLLDQEPKIRIHSKGGSIDFQPAPLDMLQELKERTAWKKVFPVHVDTMNKIMKRAAREMQIPSNINVHVHMLRKIFGTTLARNGIPMSMVSRLMRHSDISITQKFYISYGLDETSHAMNTGHSLIRLSLTEGVVLENFVQKTVMPYFRNDKRFNVSILPNSSEKEMVLRISY